MNANNLNLWQLGNEHQKLLSQLYDYETGEINELVQAQINALEPDTERKCVIVQNYIRKLESEKNEIGQLKQEIELREISYQKEIDRMGNYLYLGMKRSGIKEIKCPFFKLKIKVNPYSTDITDESLIPEKFISTKTITKIEKKPDKNSIKEEVLKTGVQVPGALVQQKEKLEVSFIKI